MLFNKLIAAFCLSACMYLGSYGVPYCVGIAFYVMQKDSIIHFCMVSHFVSDQDQRKFQKQIYQYLI